MGYWHGLLCQAVLKVGKVAKYSVKARGQESEVRSQGSGDRGSEVRSQKSEVGPDVFRISSFGFRISASVRGVCVRLREMTFRNFRPDKHLGQAKSSQRGFSVR